MLARAPRVLSRLSPGRPATARLPPTWRQVRAPCLPLQLQQLCFVSEPATPPPPVAPPKRSIRYAARHEVQINGRYQRKVKPSSLYADSGFAKNGEPHDVMLPRQAVELLKSRQGLDQVYAFPSPRDGRHVAQKVLAFAQYYARQSDGEKPPADPIQVPWTVHDLRRTAATGLAKLGCPRVVQDRILNHVDSSVAAIYDQYRYDSEARVWLQKWADHLEALTASNVVPLHMTRAA